MTTKALLTKLRERAKVLAEEGRPEPLLTEAADKIERLSDEMWDVEYRARTGRNPPDMFGN